MLRLLSLLALVFPSEAFPNPLNSINKQTGELGITLFTTPFFIKSIQEQTNESFGSTTRTIGNTATIQKRFNSSFTAGLDLTYRNQENTGNAIPLGFTQSTRVDQDRYQAGIFAEFSYKGITIKPGIRGGFDDFTLERPDLLTGLVGVSNTTGLNFGSSLEVSALLPVAKNVIVRPSATFDYSFFSTQDFTEQGAGPNNVAFDGVSDTRIEADFGLGLGYVFKQDNKSQFIVFSNAKYKRNFINGPIETGAVLASGLLDLGEVTLLTAQEANGFVIDAGFIASAGNAVEFTFFYQREFFPTSTENTFAGRLSISF